MININHVIMLIVEIIGLIEVSLVLFRKGKMLLEVVTIFIQRLGCLIKAVKVVLGIVLVS